MKKIVLDPGHGTGQNKGVCVGYYEGDAMYRYAQLLRAALERYGFAVEITRQKAADNPSLSTRGRAGAQADMLYSLHSNAASSSAAAGVTVYYSIDLPGDKPLGEALGKAVAAVMGSHVRSVKYRESEKYPGEDYYTVIDSAQDSGCPHVILLEHGFHTNPKECAWLSDTANLQRMADAEAAVLGAYFGMQVPEPEPEPGAQTIYRVQVGAFAKRSNAERLRDELRSKGYADAYIKEAQR